MSLLMDSLSKIALAFSHDIIVIPLLVIGLLCIDKALFYRAICLVMLSMLLNVALKTSFQIPLAASLNKEGFAFPSGHMQMVTVLYGWLAFKINNKLFSVFTSILLASIGASLIYAGYHNLYDVMGGIFFAAILVTTFWLAAQKYPDKLEWLMLGSASLLLLYIFIHYPPIPPHAWMAYYTLVGLISAELIIAKRDRLIMRQKLLVTIACFVVILLTHYGFQNLYSGKMPIYLYQLKWFITGFSLIALSKFRVTREEKLSAHLF